MTSGAIPDWKAFASLMLLLTWELWSGRNAGIFRNKHAPHFVVLDQIKKEARFWVTAGAKRLGELMSRE
jgi:hypothetical protein